MEGGRARDAPASPHGNHDDGLFTAGVGKSERDKSANLEVGRELGKEGRKGGKKE